MTTEKFILRPESAADIDPIGSLLNTAFGPGRFARTAYRLREGVRDIPELGWVAVNGDRLAGSLRFWPVLIDHRHQALLLGPLVVHPRWRGKGCGLALMRHTLPLAVKAGHRLVVLVGDIAYYGRAGFCQVPPGTLEMPGPVDWSRLLWLELVEGASQGVSGSLEKDRRVSSQR